MTRHLVLFLCALSPVAAGAQTFPGSGGSAPVTVPDGPRARLADAAEKLDKKVEADTAAAKEKADQYGELSAAVEAEIARVQAEALKAFEGAKPEIKAALGKAVSNLWGKTHKEAFAAFDKLNKAELSPAQRAAWNQLKAVLSSSFLQKYLGDVTAQSRPTYEAALAALREGRFEDAVAKLRELREQVSGALSQKRLLDEIIPALI